MSQDDDLEVTIADRVSETLEEFAGDDNWIDGVLEAAGVALTNENTQRVKGFLTNASQAVYDLI